MIYTQFVINSHKKTCFTIWTTTTTCLRTSSSSSHKTYLGIKIT